MLKSSPVKVRDYVRALDLPESGAFLERIESVPITGAGQEALAIGTQLTEFTAAVPADLRRRVADTMLLAQLAADKAMKTRPDAEPFAWYDKYSEVLQTVGWRLADMEQVERRLDEQGGDVHRAIIPVVTAALAPGAAAASIVLAVLKGLGDMDEDAPWITVFDRSSAHARGAKFQVGHVDVDDAGNPQMTLVCFSIDAKRTITQVLFFKFKDQETKVRQAVRKLSSTPAHLALAGDEIAERVRPFIVDFVRSIDI
ncbi:hypothetical protein SAMN05428950_104173 [Sphingomonas sp. OV641]|uniref:hypothetical protein n=1 Tax=unclassified Sphingomonas TaxID=196159 RepID=UPI00083448A4|nr:MULTISPECIES: hypothetical protein [unclassified Sphingomonas]SEJ88915.1 hypothetical protein SAMN05428950_104173 [Sphingomonas sp. OV641]